MPTIVKPRVRMVIAGIGGVGGYFGGLLARYYESSQEVEITFLARGDHLQKIRTDGLKVVRGTTEFIAHPFLATNDAEKIGVADYVIVCTKTYDLETVIEQLKPCIGPDTMLLPLLNGVDCSERIRRLLPENVVLEGCVYIVSRLHDNGLVVNSGNIQTLYFGSQNKTHARLHLLGQLLKDASIEATLTADIVQVVWEKFIFISPTATATSWLDCSIGTLIQKHEPTVLRLIDEVIQVAAAKGIHVSGETKAKTLSKLMSLPGQTTSSMHSDIKSGKSRTEIDALPRYVIEQGEVLGVPTTGYDMAYYDLTHHTEHPRSTA
jgi:2-dehydropantoate 2-reductase